MAKDDLIQIDGTVNGDIRTKTLLVGETASIKGEIVAETVKVHGEIVGQIKATNVTLAKTAHMVGDILHENLAIEEGAYLEGHCKRMEIKKDSGVNLVVKEGGAKEDVKDARKDTKKAANT